MFQNEKCLVDTFLKNHPTKINLIEECDFRWGNIDVVEYVVNDEIFLNHDQAKVLRNSRNLNIFSSLYRKRGLRLESISRKSGIEVSEVKRILNRLIEMNIVVVAELTYIVNPNINFPDIIVYAYEMKLNDIRKAINQAAINQMYSDYSYIVMPKEKEILCQKYFEPLIRNGIGLILVDEKENRLIIRARKSRNITMPLLKSKFKIAESRLTF